jgi:murein DD-endopeptidase MepM/ murein hydrolase activator NlpD
LATLCSNLALGQSNAVQSLDVRIPLAPQPVQVGEELHLFYELHLASFSSAAVTLSDLTVTDAGNGTVLASFRDDALAALIGRPQATMNADPNVLPSGIHGVIYMTMPLQRAAPTKLSHRIGLTVDIANETQFVGLTTDAVTVDTSPLPELGPPLRGGMWAALYNPAMERGHRRVFYAVDGHARLPGRFAMDFFGVDAAGNIHRNAGERPADYFGYGADVLAVADGTVVAARDDFDEPATLTTARPPVTIGDATGAYVAIDIGGNRYAFYEHLRPGLAVKVGQKVRRGDRLGALGFTGQAMRPHLHFHVANANAPLAAEGMPYHLTRYRLLGSYDSITDFGAKPWRPLPKPRDMAKSLPAANVVVSFD